MLIKTVNDDCELIRVCPELAVIPLGPVAEFPSTDAVSQAISFVERTRAGLNVSVPECAVQFH